ncbi:MAG: tetratricopeptide repeat protein [Candidatus Korobacteraceae bacterium]
MPSATASAPATQLCQNCGAELAPGVDRCPACGRIATSRSTRIVLAVTLVLIIAGFAFTQYFVNLHRQTESDLAVRWFTRGEQAMQAQLPTAAAEDYHNALSYDPDNRQYRLHLAQALLAAKRWNEARAHLTSLWEEEPASGEVNLTLARLNAQRGDYPDAVRYYGDAINGVWKEEPRKQRIATRFELARYLMQQRKVAQAQAELMALQADGPPDPADQLLLANLLLQLNEPARALDAYNAVLAHDRTSALAWLGKGQASLAIGDYHAAEQAFSNAVDRDPRLDDARQQLQLVREVLRLNPATRGLSLAERSARVAAAFQVSLQRLTSCANQQGYSLTDHEAAAVPSPTRGGVALPTRPASPTTGGLQGLYTIGLQKKAAATEQALRKNPDALEPTTQFVFDVERATAPVCPAMDLADSALLTLAQHESATVK